MGWFGNFVTGVRSLFGGKSVEREMDEELRGFLDASMEDKRRAGMSPDQAARAARIEMGSANAVKHHIRSAGWETALESFAQDLRYSIRMLVASPGFTLVAVLSLALGIGANTAIFSLMDVIMLRMLPIDEPGQLVLFGDGRAAGSNDSLPNDSSRLFSYPFYRSFSETNQVFSGVAAIDSIEFGTHGTLAGRYGISEQIAFFPVRPAGERRARERIAPRRQRIGVGGVQRKGLVSELQPGLVRGGALRFVPDLGPCS